MSCWKNISGNCKWAGQNHFVCYVSKSEHVLHLYIFTFFSNSFPLFIASFCRLSRFLFLFTSFNRLRFLLSFASSCCKELTTSHMHSGFRILLISKELYANTMWDNCTNVTDQNEIRVKLFLPTCTCRLILWALTHE